MLTFGWMNNWTNILHCLYIKNSCFELKCVFFIENCEHDKLHMCVYFLFLYIPMMFLFLIFSRIVCVEMKFELYVIYLNALTLRHEPECIAMNNVVRMLFLYQQYP